MKSVFDVNKCFKKDKLIFFLHACALYYELPSDTMCPRSSDPFYIVTYYIKWFTTSWTYSICMYKQTLKISSEAPCYSMNKGK